MRGGKRNGAGRKRLPKPSNLKRKQVVLTLEQIEFLKAQPNYKESEYIRAAIDEKRTREGDIACPTH